MDKVIGNEHNISPPMFLDLNTQNSLSLNVSSASTSDVEPASGVEDGSDVIDPSLQVLPPLAADEISTDDTKSLSNYNSGRKLKQPRKKQPEPNETNDELMELFKIKMEADTKRAEEEAERAKAAEERARNAEQRAQAAENRDTELVSALTTLINLLKESKSR